ncbi:MAG TPA: hypothetical protein VH720_15475 [Candidatus Limnocylindrales bacterium]|jgi:hypothetical protein
MALGSVTAFAGTASAASSNHKLKFENCYIEKGSHSWVKTSDSPIDTDNKALHIVVPTDGCVDAYTKASLKINRLVGDVTNLSFDFREPAAGGTVTGGSPRISILLDNGDVMFADANNCNRPIPVSGGTWGRADFTGGLEADGDCTIYLNGVIPYSNTATESAWDVYAAANPSRAIVYDFFITDIPGDYYIDRISLGTGKLYGKNNSPSGNCTTESSC